jgi:hypothetical protein
MGVKIYEPPKDGRANVLVHSYDPDRDIYTVAAGDTAGVEIPAIEVDLDYEDDFYWDDDDDYLGGYEE